MADEAGPVGTGLYEVELQDYKQFIRHGFLDLRRQNTLRWAIGLPLGLAASFLVGGLIQGTAVSDLAYGKIGLYLLIALALQAAFFFWMVRSQAKQVFAVQSKKGKRGVTVSTTLQLHENGATKDHDWADIAEVYETRDLIVFMQADGKPLTFVPVRVFAREAEASQFLQDAKANVRD